MANRTDFLGGGSDSVVIMKRQTHFLNPEFVRSGCVQAFSAKDKLQKHLLCHGEQEAKPLACSYCNRRFMNNSALACHLKIHSEKKYYQCPLCHEGEAASVCREGVVNVV